MMLLLDIGNSRIKWAWHDKDGLRKDGNASHKGSEDPTLLFEQCWGATDPGPSRLVVANVAGGTMADALTEWCQDRWQITPHFIAVSKSAAGVNNGYREPEHLGVDRWAAMIGARHRAAGSAVVVDCGTAITIDVLARGGKHSGGLILPGIGMMAGCVLAGTHGVDRPVAGNDGRTRGALLARDTKEAVEAGTLYAAVAFLDRVLNDVRAELGDKTRAWITGGDAPRLLGLINPAFEHAPLLVLEGLLKLAQEGDGK
ncbi:MAG: type III pantothenate kinase [Chromatiales bacterium]|nr:type III pantothenate kinase [Chromatiales bacterium]